VMLLLRTGLEASAATNAARRVNDRMERCWFGGAGQLLHAGAASLQTAATPDMPDEERECWNSVDEIDEWVHLKPTQETARAAWCSALRGTRPQGDDTANFTLTLCSSSLKWGFPLLVKQSGGCARYTPRFRL